MKDLAQILLFSILTLAACGKNNALNHAVDNGISEHVATAENVSETQKNNGMTQENENLALAKTGDAPAEMQEADKEAMPTPNACLRDDDCKETGFCDSALGYLCSARCTQNADCPESMFCRKDGRCSPRIFETIWEINDEKILILPIRSRKGCALEVDWGDGGGFKKIPCRKAKHRYARKGTYHVKLRGRKFEWSVDMSRVTLEERDLGEGERTEEETRNCGLNRGWPLNIYCLVEIVSFGPVAIGPGAFIGADNVKMPERDIPDASAWFDAEAMFVDAHNVSIGHWDTRNVTNMHRMFYDSEEFDEKIGNWDVSNVTDMSGMFDDARLFDQDISRWDVSNVTNMRTMFHNAYNFNQDISRWNVSKVTDMNEMFEEAFSFNADISRWDVSNVTDMYSMFRDADAFNADIGNWNVSHVVDMHGMFYAADAFNADISRWDVSNVKILEFMFYGTKLFNRDIGNWNVRNCETFDYMFHEARAFDQDLSRWQLNDDATAEKALESSGLRKDNYCAMMKNDAWKKRRNSLALTYDCP